jgi:peptide subunit release factor 1 (eRF1)
MDLKARIAELARIGATPSPVVTVYLNTHWADEHQRDRVRIFLKNELARARGGPHPRAAEADLRWVEAEGEARLKQAAEPGARGVALFACEAVGLREVLASRIAFPNVFAVADTPLLRPLAELSETAPTTLVVFIDAASARLVLVPPVGAGEEVVLQGDVPGHHSRGGWAQLAQSRYQRHIQDHRARHFDAVAAVLIELAERHAVRRLILAGDPRNVAVFREALPARLAGLVVGVVAGARHDPTALIVERAAELLPHVEGQRIATEVDGVLTTAAKRGNATAGLDATLEALNRGAVHRLYLLDGWRAPGRRCTACGTLQGGFTWQCPACGGESATVELAEAMAERVIATGGSVETIAAHQGLGAAGGIAAELRYPV